MDIHAHQKWIKRQHGFTLVELMVSFLIVAIVMMGWWRIMNATSPYREAQRRAAIELAVGILDIFPVVREIYPSSQYWIIQASGEFNSTSSPNRHSFPGDWFPGDSSICYQMRTVVIDGESITDISNCLPHTHAWTYFFWDDVKYEQASCQTKWVVIELYDGEDTQKYDKPFATFSQLLYGG